MNELQKSYDAIAENYAIEYQHELNQKPFDRKILDWLIEEVNGRGIICDMGCGPGQIARYLKDHGAETFGVDLSEGMVKEATRLNPEIAFEQGDMFALSKITDSSIAGIAAFYSIVHIPSHALVNAFREFIRVLIPGGVLLLSFHVGSEEVHRDEWWGKEVSIDFFFFETEEIKRYLGDAGFVLSEVIQRDPNAEVEYPSRRSYIFANKI